MVATCFAANDPRPIVGPGASKDDVLNSYGWPTGQSQLGNREILNYPQGTVTLIDGKVEKVSFNMNMTWPPPRPRPGTAPVATEAKNDLLSDLWHTRYGTAAAEAARRNVPILALFTGSDWSPASKAFQEEVAFQSEFVSAFTGEYVLLWLDFPTRSPQPANVVEENQRVRERYGVITYPAVLLIGADGELKRTVDLSAPRPGQTYRERMIAAVRGARLPPGLPKKKVELPPLQKAVEASTEGKSTTASVVQTSLARAQALVLNGVTIGVIVAILLGWAVWRWTPKFRGAVRSDLSSRMADAGSGIPSAVEVVAWPRERLRAVVAGIAETNDYVVLPGDGGDVDFRLKRPREPKPCIVVHCAPGGPKMPPTGVKRVRAVLGAMTLEGVPSGWMVSPMGFTDESKVFAEKNNIVLIDGAQIRLQLRDLPPLLLPKVMNRQAV
ncbi:MAG TPA: restriction endonuclease [Opitutaceae bacterium]